MKRVISYSNIRLINYYFLFFFLFTSMLFAQNPFEGISVNNNNKVIRDNLNLYGGPPKRIEVSSTGNIFLGIESPNGVFCSSDNGASWEALPQDSDVGSVSDIALGEDNSTLYFIGGVKLYKTNLCSTLTELTLDGEVSDFGKSVVYAHNILLVAARDGSIYKSSDNGSSFTKVTVDGSLTSAPIIAASPNSNEFFAMYKDGNNQKFYKSTDGGSSWSDTSVSISCSDCNEFNINSHGVMVVTSPTKVYISVDNGVTFSEKNPTNPLTRSYISFINSTIYVGANYTDDNGDIWQNFNDTATSTTTELIGPIAVDPSDANRLYSGSLRGFAISTNSGDTWIDSVTGLYAVSLSGIVQSSDKNTVYLAGTGGLAKSTDFTTGPTWNYPIDVTGGGDAPTAIFMPDTSNPDLLLVGARSAIYKTENGGTSFSQATISSSSYDNTSEVVGFAKTSSGTIVAIYNNQSGEGGVLKSEDNGSTWSDHSFTANATTQSVATLNDTIFVGVGNENDDNASKRGIYMYNGTSWSQLSGDFDGHIITDMASDTATNTIYAVSGGQTAQASVFKSSDGGTTWEDLKDNGLPTDAWYRTVAIDPNDSDSVYVATGRPASNGFIYISEDGGDSWSLFAQTLIDEVPSDMLIDGPLMPSSTGINAFDKLTCFAKKKKNKIIAYFKKGDSIVTDLSTFGIKKAFAIVNGNGKKIKKKMKLKKGKAVVRNLSSGKYKVRCKAKTASSNFKIKAKKKVKIK